MEPLVCNLESFKGQVVTLKGWASNIRSSGKIHFVELRDGSGFVQCVAQTSELKPSALQALSSLTHESSLIVTGKVVEHPKRPGVYELALTDIEVVQLSQDYPLGRKEHGPDFLLDHRHLWLRSRKQWAIQRIRNTIINAIYDFLRGENFIKIDSPIITSNSCEGALTLFELEYFDLGKGYLSQSGQLYLEAAIYAHGRVFDFGPVFRAEKSKTKKHLTEFWMMDAEMAFVEHEDNMRFQERLICYILECVLECNRAELEIMERDISRLERIKAPFPRITYCEIVKELREMGAKITEDMDLGAGDEQLLAARYDQPLFVERWPAKLKAFYMKCDPRDPSLVLGSDLMAPEAFGEIIGGSQREDNYEVLAERMEEEKIPLEPLRWYLDLRKYGTVPHSGFGVGLERLVAWISGAAHIRETIPFPRMIYRYYP